MEESGSSWNALNKLISEVKSQNPDQVVEITQAGIAADLSIPEHVFGVI